MHSHFFVTQYVTGLKKRVYKKVLGSDSEVSDEQQACGSLCALMKQPLLNP